MDQLRQIKRNKWLTELEIERIKRRVGRGGENTRQEGSLDNRGQEEPVENQYEQGYGHNESMQCCSEEGTDATITGDGEVQWSEEEETVLKRLKRIMDEPNRKRIPVLKNMNRKKILAEIWKVEEVLKQINTNNITELNSLLYAAAVFVSENL